MYSVIPILYNKCIYIYGHIQYIIYNTYIYTHWMMKSIYIYIKCQPWLSPGYGIIDDISSCVFI